MQNEFAEDLLKIDAPQWFLEKYAGMRHYLPYTLVYHRRNVEVMQKFESGADKRQLLREYNLSDRAFRWEQERRRKKNKKLRCTA